MKTFVSEFLTTLQKEKPLLSETTCYEIYRKTGTFSKNRNHDTGFEIAYTSIIIIVYIKDI